MFSGLRKWFVHFIELWTHTHTHKTMFSSWNFMEEFCVKMLAMKSYLIFYIFFRMWLLLFITKIIDSNDAALFPNIGQCQFKDLASLIGRYFQRINVDIFWFWLFICKQKRKRNKSILLWKIHYSFVKCVIKFEIDATKWANFLSSMRYELSSCYINSSIYRLIYNKTVQMIVSIYHNFFCTVWIALAGTVVCARRKVQSADTDLCKIICT